MGTSVSKSVKEREETGIRVIQRDATKSLNIRVEKADIVSAQAKNYKRCVIARATRRTNARIVDAWIFKTSACIHIIRKNGVEEFVRYTTSARTRAALIEFDETGQFRPGIYTLEPPRGSATREAISARSKKRPGRHQPGASGIVRKPRTDLRTAWSGV